MDKKIERMDAFRSSELSDTDGRSTLKMRLNRRYGTRSVMINSHSEQQNKIIMIENNTETLKQQVMISHFTNATGCSTEQARQLLQASRWEFETALSVFFQEASITVNQGTPLHQRHPGGPSPLCPPCNTPATPPSFPDALLALQKLQASDWSVATSPPQQQPSKVLASCNHMPPPNDRYSTANCDWVMGVSNDLPKDIVQSPGSTEPMHHSGISENNGPQRSAPMMMFPVEAQQ